MLNKNYNILRVTRNEMALVNVVSGSKVVADETALIYNRVVSGLVSEVLFHGHMPTLVNCHLSVW